MDDKWKKAFWWSSLGGLIVGATVALARKPKGATTTAPACRSIPSDCREIVAYTERFQSREDGREQVVRDKYLIQPTRFKLWSVLELGTAAASTKAIGSPIYHIAHLRIAEAETEVAEESSRLLERYYGTITAGVPGGGKCPGNSLARGAFLLSDKCYVGGS
ncbi:MAG: hypothetical protein ABIG68_12200, partial [Acidobacteriota bacterium]